MKERKEPTILDSMMEGIAPQKQDISLYRSDTSAKTLAETVQSTVQGILEQDTITQAQADLVRDLLPYAFYGDF